MTEPTAEMLTLLTERGNEIPPALRARLDRIAVESHTRVRNMTRELRRYDRIANDAAEEVAS